MSGPKYLVLKRGATVDESIVAEFRSLDEAVMHAVIQYSEWDRERLGVIVCRDEDGIRSYEF